ncbi:MAG: hypothetical protein WD823_00125, partial [Sulfuricaulis sp.]|uniref:hypothetical protein n=1 Tax=Sulfuricaulis sp. TaxID=2003553 RepID=UPI0034A3AEFF
FEGAAHRGLHADIKQPVGSSYETAPLEVSKPANYKGPFNYAAFRDAAEAYYRGLVGSQGGGIRVGGGRNIRMRNNRFAKESVSEFDVDSSGGVVRRPTIRSTPTRRKRRAG